MTQSKTTLRIDSSARKSDSVSRALTRAMIDKLDPDKIISRDVAEGVPFINEDWVAANFTEEEVRTDAQKNALLQSDVLVEEVLAADTLVIGAPIYNFGVSAALKAWIDMIARARKTFQYTPNGSEGLLVGKKAYVLIATGGTEVGGEIDFVSGYLKHFLGFIGITDVTIIAADQQAIKGDEPVGRALEEVAAL